MDKVKGNEWTALILIRYSNYLTCYISQKAYKNIYTQVQP